MAAVKELFKDSLKEQGISDFSVSVHSSASMCDTITVRKQIGKETYNFSTTVSYHRIQQNEKQKVIAMQAREVADKINEEMHDVFSIGITRIRVNPYNEPSATCLHCGTEVGLPRDFESSNQLFTDNAELSIPKPIPRNRQETINSFDGFERLVLKLYLIGKVERECRHNYDDYNQKV